ncbi:MAG: CBS domain-containing protein [Acidimicrobiales bacterium]|jgi:signal-transduction protein with cAMP-binding, CBS, and nucleotidyltransferase domain|nr:CBS domain-containing protein [Acidimicrobiales bacterium]
MRVADHMSSPAVVCLTTNSAQQAARLMQEHRVGVVVVIDLDHRPVGILTDRDLATRVLARGLDPATPVQDVMTRDVVTIGTDIPAADAARHMAARTCRRLPVINEHGQVIGVVGIEDLLPDVADEIYQIARVLAPEHHASRL